jgi:hypothetical protein
MKNIIIITLFLLPKVLFTQNNFTHDYLVNSVVDNKRWESDIKIYIYGDCSEENKNTIKETITYFNSLLETIQISLVDKKDESNSIIYFLTDEEYNNLFSYCDHSDNIGATYTKKSLKVDNTIIESDIHVDTYQNRKFDSFEYVIKHEMFHMLGFKHHHNESNSIIHHSENYTEKDKEMIKYLYSKDFKF